MVHKYSDSSKRYEALGRAYDRRYEEMNRKFEQQFPSERPVKVTKSSKTQAKKEFTKEDLDKAIATAKRIYEGAKVGAQKVGEFTGKVIETAKELPEEIKYRTYKPQPKKSRIPPHFHEAEYGGEKVLVTEENL